VRILAPLRDDGFLCSCWRRLHPQLPAGDGAVGNHLGRHLPQPGDGRDYIVSYNDCCGKRSCGRCLCNRNENDKPLYIRLPPTITTGARAVSGALVHLRIGSGKRARGASGREGEKRTPESRPSLSQAVRDAVEQWRNAH